MSIRKPQRTAMTENAKNPDACMTMLDVRAGVDETDSQLITLLEKRFAYMRAAARIKSERNAVRDEVRKSTVIKNAEQAAEKAGIPSDAIAEIWDRLVESSIEYEMQHWDSLRD